MSAQDSTENILKECTGEGPAYRISGSDISLFIESPFSLYCKSFVDHSERDPPDASQALFTEYGHNHEARLMQEKYPNGEYKPPRKPRRRAGRPRRKLSTQERGALLDRSRARAFEESLMLMRGGAQDILEPQLCFLPSGFHGSPDILEKREGQSRLGGHHYIIKEIKSSKRIRKKHIMQAAFYNMMLGRIQEYVPQEFYLLNAQGEDNAYQYADYQNQISDIISGIASIKEGKMPEVFYGRGIFPWSNYADKMAIERDDLSLISGMEGESRRALESHGIKTLSQLLETKNPGCLEPAAMSKYIAHAKAIKSGRAVRFGQPIQVPGAEKEMFIRVEEGLNGEVYMIGAYLRTKEATRYVPFVVLQGFNEEAMLQEFLNFAESHRDCMMYYWGSGGETPFSQLVRRHQQGMAPDMPMVDLQRVATAVVAFPTYRNKLKMIVEWMGFRWTDPEAEWGKGVVMHREYLQNPSRVDCLDYIKTYNRDNCTAIATVWDWLGKNKCLERG